MLYAMVHSKGWLTLSFAAILALFADVVPGIPSDISQYTALTALIAVLIWIVTKTIPSMMSDYKEQGKAFAETIERHSMSAANAAAEALIKSAQTTAEALKEATASRVRTEDKFIETLAGMDSRTHDDHKMIVQAIHDMDKHRAQEHDEVASASGIRKRKRDDGSIHG